MDRAPGVNVVEKQRLREAINEQVRRYLEDGGTVKVIQTPRDLPGKAAYTGVGDVAIEFAPGAHG